MLSRFNAFKVASQGRPLNAIWMAFSLPSCPLLSLTQKPHPKEEQAIASKPTTDVVSTSKPPRFRQATATVALPTFLTESVSSQCLTSCSPRSLRTDQSCVCPLCRYHYNRLKSPPCKQRTRFKAGLRLPRQSQHPQPHPRKKRDTGKKQLSVILDKKTKFFIFAS